MSQKAQQGDTVAVHYTGTLDSGDVFDSSRGREPIEFEVGGGQVIAGFDSAVEGLTVGERREIRIEPDQAYGQQRDDLVVEVPKEQLPAEAEPQVGQQVQVQVAPDEQRIARIADIDDSSITLDLNHPLAGQPLNFEVEVVRIS